MVTAATIVITYWLWQLVRGILDQSALGPPVKIARGEEGEQAIATRLQTVGPVLRNFLFVALVAIATLVCLGSLGVNITPVNDVSIRFSGAYSKHKFTEYIERGTKYNGNEMNNAPAWLYNTELWYRPSFVKGLRLGVELQHVGEYFVDPLNTARYDGYNVVNVRVGYRFKLLELWLNVLNVTDDYYSYITTKSSFGYSYQLAEPRNFNAGITYDFGQFFKKN